MPRRTLQVRKGENPITLFDGEQVSGVEVTATRLGTQIFVFADSDTSAGMARPATVWVQSYGDVAEDGWRRLGSVAANNESYVIYVQDA